MTPTLPKPPIAPPPGEIAPTDKARGRRNLALGGSLLLFVVLIFVITIAKMHALGRIR
jgi:hypothetical protein